MTALSERASCARPKDLREAGYLPLQMTWPKPLPKAGTYLRTRGRARFAYRICEVERYDAPRGQYRFTCRLWCVRVLPEDVPVDALVHSFYWNPRKKKKR
jgi:hypothetical protein